jgi:hypothetical protein
MHANPVEFRTLTDERARGQTTLPWQRRSFGTGKPATRRKSGQRGRWSALADAWASSSLFALFLRQMDDQSVEIVRDLDLARQTRTGLDLAEAFENR